MDITWDERKAESNLKKHGVSFDEAQSVLMSDVQLILDDNSHDEPRFVVIGFSAKTNLLTVIYAYRDEEEIRIISARRATKREAAFYEERI